MEVDRPAEVPSVQDLLSRLVDLPKQRPRSRYALARERFQSARTPNYLLMEARNASLGSASEEFVVNFERARLSAAGRERLASKVEQVSRTRGDHEGFDVLSFDADSRERLISEHAQECEVDPRGSSPARSAGAV